ncbi:EthD family reductase [Thermoactinomyces sp. DSM 45892]|uniref:EthD family reductase n=1 Tax=Thermoactinomyces sp. DSM 45892 TaxID=1882753 RepID=UPI00089BBD0E|nr:EthD family reductase [Thermoactinomyces sp. DSM 45892]SDZ33314.1 conserved hypothetical protein [Thermoactinomyces sp. DSM 45892]
MVKLTALYRQPEEVQEFETRYFEGHVPLAEKMPGLLKMEVTRFTATPMGTQPPYYLQADLYFESEESLQASMKSPEGKAAAKDVMSFAGKLVTMIVGEVKGDA